MRLYLIRHGQSTNNALADSRLRVHDPALTEIGVQQAHLIADYLAQQSDTPMGGSWHPEPFTLTRLYVSPMLRTLQTAQPIAQALNLPMQVWVDVHESGGMFLEDWEKETIVGYPGLTKTDIESKFPEAIVSDGVTEKGWWDAEVGREEAAYAMMRAIRVSSELKQLVHTTERIAIVTHGAFMDSLIKALLYQLPHKEGELFYLHYNTGITRFDIHEGMDDLRLHYLNRVDHLPQHLRTV